MFIQLTYSEATALGLAIHQAINANYEIIQLGLTSSDYRKDVIEQLKTIQNKLNGTESKLRLEATA